MSITYLTPWPHRSQVTAQNTQKEKTLSPTSGRPRRRRTHSTKRQGRLLLSSASIDFITHSPGIQKIEIHPPTMGEKPGGLQEDCREKAFSLCFVCSSSSLGEKKMSSGQEWHMQKERLAGLRDLLYLHIQPLMHAAPLILSQALFFFFSTFFFHELQIPGIWPSVK